LNIGVKNGPASHGIIDVDLDRPEAIIAANHILPFTSWVAGRKSSPRSHRWFKCIPTPATTQYKDVDGQMLVELRAGGTQTICPPSTHESGEDCIWHEMNCDPTSINGNELERLVSRVAAATIIARHWPDQGSRHQCSMALAGGLL